MALTVAIEGLPGSGKTTVIQAMMADLRKRGHRVKMVDIETTGHAPALRAIASVYPFNHPVRSILFWALRLEQYDAIEKMRECADVIFADRFWGTTLAFDVYGNGVPRQLLDWLGQYIQRQPDLTLFLEAPLEVVKRRKKGQTMSDIKFARRVEQGYQELADALSWVRVDATPAPTEVKERCLQIVLSKL